jgi:hypothetical protein
VLQDRKDPVEWKVDPVGVEIHGHSTLFYIGQVYIIQHLRAQFTQLEFQKAARNLAGVIEMPQEACIQIKEELVACVIRSDW